jgi:HPt (histidine-containing phosphotransfer) domain-containing protein
LRQGVDWGDSPSKTRRSCGKFAQRSVNQFRDWLTETTLPIDTAGRSGLKAMPLHLERIQWMPSPPLAPDDGPIDFDHLKRMTLGDAGLEQEVLAMFAAQSSVLVGTLATMPPEAAALAHTLKGSARAIGAFAVADAAARLEAVIASGADPADELTGLGDAVALARTAIEAVLRRS